MGTAVAVIVRLFLAVLVIAVLAYAASKDK